MYKLLLLNILLCASSANAIAQGIGEGVTHTASTTGVVGCCCPPLVALALESLSLPVKILMAMFAITPTITTPV
jgi:hypothetical protein